MKIKKIKKGELTTQQIVILIIAITSFAIILFLLFRLNLGKTTDNEICHDSVVRRGNSILPEGTTPLTCHTSYICITEDGTCEEMTEPEIKKVKTKEEIYQILADEMVDCWWMFGEGKIEYIKKGWTHENYCSICSQLGFDNSIKNIKDFEEGQISKDDFYDYLMQKEISNKDLTYSEYFFGTKNINVLKEMALQQHGLEGTFGEIKIDKRYYIVMGITTEVDGWVVTMGSIGAVIGGIVMSHTPLGWIAGAVIVGGAGIGVGTIAQEISDSIEPEILAITIEGKEGVQNKFMAPTIIEEDSNKFKALNCESIEILV